MTLPVFGFRAAAARTDRQDHGNNTERRQAGGQSAAGRPGPGGGQVHVEVTGPDGRTGGTHNHNRDTTPPGRAFVSHGDGGLAAAS